MSTLRSDDDRRGDNHLAFDADEATDSVNRKAEHPGRGAHCRPANRFERIAIEPTLEQLEDDDVPAHLHGKLRTLYYPDSSQSVVTENHSPDIGFRFSINPYRGCLHGCSYCYARPTHEYLGFDAGLDFETKILVKRDAAELFRRWLCRRNYSPEPVMMSGVTDCYQPAEKHFRVTRQCLEVAEQSGQPINIVTKNALVTGDIDLLAKMARRRLVSIAVSITSLDASLAGVLEPRTSRPDARLRAIEQLTAAGITTQLMIAPIIPGLNDHEIPSIIQRAAQAGVSTASYVMLRLPSSVKPVFFDWLRKKYPDRFERVQHRIEGIRDGKHSDARFGTRMRGTGNYARQIRQTFDLFAKRAGLRETLPPLSIDQFRAPHASDRQGRLF